MKKILLCLLLIAGCEPRHYEQPRYHYVVHHYEPYKVSAEDDARYVKNVKKWIDDHFNDPTKVEWIEKEYYSCEELLFERVQMRVKLRITNSQGIITLKRYRINFGGPTGPEHDIHDEYAIIQVKNITDIQD